LCFEQETRSKKKLERMTSRPVVSVFDPENAESVVSTVSLPAVFTAPIRSDIVHYVHTLMAKNARQAYAVSEKAGHQVRIYYCCFLFFSI
jgi:large subunit ribosomal protein L4e